MKEIWPDKPEFWKIFQALKVHHFGTFSNAKTCANSTHPILMVGKNGRNGVNGNIPWCESITETMLLMVGKFSNRNTDFHTIAETNGCLVFLCPFWV
jgi:hypothetical protein